MKNKLLTVLKYTLPLLLAVWLLFYLVRQVGIEQILETFRHANYNWIFLSSIFALIAHWSRAARWRLLLRPLGYQPSIFNTFLAVMVGYFANFALPRIGEVTRCGVLRTTDKVPVDAGFGTVVAERIFDLIMLAIVTGLTLLLEFKRLNTFFNEFLSTKISGYQQLVESSYWIIVILAGLFVVFIILFYKFKEAILQNAIAKKIQLFLKGMWEGVISVKNLDKKWEFIFHTVLIWVMYFSMTYVLFFALPQTANLGWRAGLTVLVMGSFGMAAPVQGGVGTFHWLVSSTLVFYGLKEADGINLAFFMHGSQMLLLFAAGGLSTIIFSLIAFKKNNIENTDKSQEL